MAIKRSNKRKAPEHQEDTRPKWKKIDDGVHYHKDGQVVRKGEILYAHDYDLSTILKTGFQCLDIIPAADLGKTLIVKSRGGGWYDVVNSVNLQKLNSKPLRREAAESFLPEGQELDDALDEEESKEE